MRYIQQVCKDLGTGASISVFEPGWMKNVVAMAKAGTLPRGSKLNIYFASDNMAGLAPPIPVALSLNLPEPETTDLALIEVRLGYELSGDVKLFLGKLDTLAYDRNEFAHGDGDEKFLNTAFSYNPIATKTIAYSVLGAGFHVSRHGGAYERWLLAATGQTDHDQTYPWGELVLADYRQEGYLFQINYSE